VDFQKKSENGWAESLLRDFIKLFLDWPFQKVEEEKYR
jgi:hypothetical protein